MYSGLVKNLDIDLYHADPALSHSKLVKMATGSPKHLKHYLDNNIQDKSRSLSLGTIFHDMVLEPEKFYAEVMRMPKISAKSNAGKEEIAAWERKALSQDKRLVAGDDYKVAENMAEAVLSHPLAHELIIDAFHEQSYFWEEGDQRFRIRPDSLPKQTSAIVDLKSCKSASRRQFLSSVWKWRYDIQAALYVDGMNVFGRDIRRFVFIAVDNSSPYAVGIYTLTSTMIQNARNDYKALVEQYKKCIATNNWPGYTEEIVEIGTKDIEVEVEQVLEEDF